MAATLKTPVHESETSWEVMFCVVLYFGIIYYVCELSQDGRIVLGGGCRCQCHEEREGKEERGFDMNEEF